jgi:superfamily II DNA/RNA helicase
VSFANFEFNPFITRALSDIGFDVPTPVQAQAIPVAMQGKDILASAQTGTGKTAAFLLPALQRISIPSTQSGTGPRLLVLTPTRELAMQVTEAARSFGKYMPRLSVVSIVGGVPYFKQRQKLRGYVDILVATPGRLIDYMGQGAMDFKRVEMLVLDEADRMLDMGFRDSVREIVQALPQTRQTLLFSATVEESILSFASKLQRDAVRIEVTPPKQKHLQIEERLHYVRDIDGKRALLAHLLKQNDVFQAIIFTGTKHGADRLAKSLHKQGHNAAALHGDMRQNARTRTIQRLREGEIKVLVATDVAARGIDVPTISHIFNFDLPRGREDYVHRIGRTGRADSKGIAVSIAYPDERGQVRGIENFIGHAIPAQTVEGFDGVLEIAHEERSRPRSSKPFKKQFGGRGNRFRKPFRQGRDSGSSRGGRASHQQSF